MPVGGSLRIPPDSIIRLNVRASVTTPIYGTLDVLFDDGEERIYTARGFENGGDRLVDTIDMGKTGSVGGHAVAGRISIDSPDVVFPGQLYAAISIDPDRNPTLTALMRNYVANGDPLELGTIKEAGPRGGPGFFNYISDEATNDSDKVITVPVNALWRLHYLWIEYSCTATANTRNLQVTIQDTADDIRWSSRRLQMEANEGGRMRLTSGAGVGEASTVANPENATESLFEALPDPTYLFQGEDIRVVDVSAVDAAADDMQIHLVVEEWLVVQT